MSDREKTTAEKTIENIEHTLLRVLRLAYLRPILRGGGVEPFQMEEAEIDAALEIYEKNIRADMILISECVRSTYFLGSASNPPQPADDDIILEGNT